MKSKFEIKFKKSKIKLRGVEVMAFTSGDLIFLVKDEAEKIREALGGWYDLERREYCFVDKEHEGWEINCDFSHINVGNRNIAVYNFIELVRL